MKRSYLPYIIGILLALVLGALLLAGRKERRFDPRVTLRETDKIPYGTAAARGLLPWFFPDAAIITENEGPHEWTLLDREGKGQVAILLSDHFNAEEEELDALLQFVRNGNDALIVSHSFSHEAQAFFSITYEAMRLRTAGTGNSLQLQLQSPPFAGSTLYTYPGVGSQGRIYQFDTARTQVLGRNGNGYANFIRLRAGSGNLYLHLVPLAFSNYFVLHKNNRRYLEGVLSLLPKDASKVAWSEYYRSKQRKQDNNDPNWLRVLMRYPSFKWALLTGAAAILLYILLGMRRNQRMIPPRPPVRNESLDFVKTLGRLYYDQRDHKNLAGKISVFFLEHVRSRYKLATTELDEAFVARLGEKSGYDREKLDSIVGFIRALPSLPAVSEGQLFQFHQQVEQFYQNT